VRRRPLVDEVPQQLDHPVAVEERGLQRLEVLERLREGGDARDRRRLDGDLRSGSRRRPRRRGGGASP
jgi:hypothetical protein